MPQIFTQGHALVVGVGADLPNTIDDAAGFAAILRDPERCAYPPDQVHLLTGPAATRAAILARLDQLAAVADEASTLVFYFSGHGYEVASPIGQSYFLMPYGYRVIQLLQTAISDVELTGRLAAIPARKTLVLLDCCHAGGFEGQKAPGVTLTKAPLPAAAVARLTQGSGYVFIASSRADELSSAGTPYSAFTLALVEALAGEGNAARDGYVRVADIALHAREMVPRRTADQQHPILHFEQASNYVVAYYAAGEMQPKGLPFDPATIAIESDPAARARSVQISVGSGAAAVGDGNTVLGERAVNVGGDAGGDINTGG